MTLKIRKVLYAILGSGAIFSALMALIPLAASVDTFISPPPDMGFLQRMGMLLAIAVCGGCVVGTVAGFVAIFSLPVSSHIRRRWLTAGIAAGVVPAAGMFVAMTGGGDGGVATVCFFGMPAAVGIALLAELWWHRRASTRETRT